MELPTIFYEKMRKLLGDDFESFLSSYEDERLYGLRVNTLKISCEEFEKICPFEIRKIPWIPNGYYYNGNESPAKHPYYHAGLYYIQEPSAMTPASRLDIEEYDAVLDLCAAPGGKATELGAKLRGSGVLVANDISNSRAKALLKNIELFGIRNPFVVNESPYSLAEHFEGFFDKILLDAPCSGEGMFRKDPAVMKSYEANGVEYYAKIQREIIGPAVRMLKPGGRLLYSTCTFSPEEDEQSVEYILENFPEMKLVEMEGYEGFATGRPEWGKMGNFNHKEKEPDEVDDSESRVAGPGVAGNPELRKCVRIWPHRMGGEGHFIALLEKDAELYGGHNVAKNDGLSYENERAFDVKSSYRNIGRAQDAGLARGREKSLRNQLEYFYEFVKDLNWEFDEKRLELQGNRLFYMPEGLLGLKGMRFLRNGLYLGDCLNKRFEPSQALAMAIGRGEYGKTVSFAADDIRVIKYLKGETIQLEAGEETSPGWNLVCVDNFPLGWAKAGGTTLKNKYHSGWRLM